MNGKNTKESKGGLAAFQGVLHCNSQQEQKQNKIRSTLSANAQLKRKQLYISFHDFFFNVRISTRKKISQQQASIFSCAFLVTANRCLRRRKSRVAAVVADDESLCGGLRFHSCFHMIKTSLPEALWLHPPLASS